MDGTMQLDALAVDLKRAAATLRDPTPVMTECAQIVADDLARSISEGVSPGGGALLPLAHSRPGGGGGGPLDDSGALRLSMKGGPDHVRQVRRDGFIVGTRRLGARLMQDGGWVLPKRTTFLAIPASAEAKAAGSPLNFPRPLVPRIGLKGGVLIEPNVMGAVGVVHYYLTRSVFVPARRPVDMSERALAAVTERIAQRFTEAFGKA